MEIVAWWLALWLLRIVAVLLFLSMGFGWAVAILFWMGKLRWR